MCAGKNIFIALAPSHLTFIVVSKCLICNEKIPLIGLENGCKPLISLEIFGKRRLPAPEFLIQCKKVQLSGKKCPLSAFNAKGQDRVSRCIVAESGWKGAFVGTDKAP
jgi:hypothetical protein